MSVDRPQVPDVLRGEGVGSALASVSRPGLEASLHLEVATQRLWLIEHRIDSYGEDSTATSAHDGLASSFARGTLIVGGQVSPPIVHIEVLVGARAQSSRPGVQGAWLTVVDDLELPFECVVRGLDDAGARIEQRTLDFAVDAPSSVAGRLANARRRFGFVLRHRLATAERHTLLPIVRARSHETSRAPLVSFGDAPAAAVDHADGALNFHGWRCGTLLAALTTVSLLDGGSALTTAAAIRRRDHLWR